MKRAVALGTVVIAVAAAGCGGSDDESAGGAEAWASSVCTAVSTYTDSLKEIGNAVTSEGLSKDVLLDALEEAGSATDEFVSALEGLGELGTEQGAQAKQIVDDLAAELHEEVETIQGVADELSGSSTNELLNTVATIGTTLASAGQQLATAFGELKQLDPDGELERAFEDAAACDSLG